MKSRETFRALLSKAVHVIAINENKNIALVQDELGLALGRNNGSCIDYWRRGHIPSADADILQLAQVIAERKGLATTELKTFLLSANPLFTNEQVSALLPPSPSPSPNGALTGARPVSPFVVGPPITNPSQFYGRTQEIRRLTNWWQTTPLQNVAVVGLKRSGKTSLLHYLKNMGQDSQLNPTFLPIRWVFIDFQDPRLVRQERALQYILHNLGFTEPPTCTLEKFMDMVAYQITTPTIILMDELVAGLESPDLNEPFWWSMRSLVSHYADGNLGFVLTSHRAPMELAEAQGKPSPFFNMFNTITLGPFQESEARELIASSPRPFTAADTDWIVAQSQCWPALVQILCQVRLDELLGNLPKGRHWQAEGLNQMARFNYLLA